jgi:hypothetical protein
MRLIRINPDGSLSLVQYIDNKPIPPYGILSHTWLLAEDEVTFKDMHEGHGMEKKGYAKITFCAERAHQDGLRYFWIDTCCIDKSQGPELSEAITSMYRWYQKAAKCYVFLRDVRCGTASRPAVEKAIRRSRWFKRGWTLQELLAPPHVTRIPLFALTGLNLGEIDIETRISWMKGRRTTKPEDKVYALLGLVGVAMIPNYGEEYHYAYARLEKEIHRRSKRSEENRLQLLQAQSYKMSPDLNFPGCGSFNEMVRIDDGLTAPYYIPLQWCKNPEVCNTYATAI